MTSISKSVHILDTLQIDIVTMNTSSLSSSIFCHACYVEKSLLFSISTLIFPILFYRNANLIYTCTSMIQSSWSRVNWRHFLWYLYIHVLMSFIINCNAFHVSTCTCMYTCTNIPERTEQCVEITFAILRVQCLI